MYKIIVKDKDITAYTANLNWRDSVDMLGAELNFDVAVNRHDENFSFLRDITLGDSVQLINNKGESLLQAIIVSENLNEKTTNFVAYDMAWYLNKSTVIRQFKKKKHFTDSRFRCNLYVKKLELKLKFLG